LILFHSGTDEKAIIAVMGHRATPQREELVKMYKTMYGKVSASPVALTSFKPN
jgi:hypothetical protein